MKSEARQRSETDQALLLSSSGISIVPLARIAGNMVQDLISTQPFPKAKAFIDRSSVPIRVQVDSCRSGTHLFDVCIKQLSGLLRNVE